MSMQVHTTAHSRTHTHTHTHTTYPTERVQHDLRQGFGHVQLSPAQHPRAMDRHAVGIGGEANRWHFQVPATRRSVYSTLVLLAHLFSTAMRTHVIHNAGNHAHHGGSRLTMQSNAVSHSVMSSKNDRVRASSSR